MAWSSAAGPPAAPRAGPTESSAVESLTPGEVSKRMAEVFAIRLLDALDGNGPHVRSHDGWLRHQYTPLWSVVGFAQEPGDAVSAAIEVQRVWRLPIADLWAGRRALWWTVGPAGELAVLLVHRRQLRRSRYVKGWVGWKPEVPFDGVLVIRRAEGPGQRRRINDLRVRPSHIALLPDSRLLIVSGRTSREESGSWEPNAVVCSLEGEHQGTFCIGDDIPVLMTDQNGSAWTAYGDEGIYRGHPESAAGLAGWSTDGRAMWAPEGRLPDAPLEGCTRRYRGGQDMAGLVLRQQPRRHVPDTDHALHG